eukprot:GFYU01003384.1.p1 GENE.GFYU01003384.1~~GFYU01003384.1.p1  ORF type:complete len:601 (-),score=104.72 GFYU01003384.1:283-2085(-)
MLECLHGSFASKTLTEPSSDVGCSPPCLVHQIFSLQLVQLMTCECGEMSEPFPYSTYIIYAPAFTLRKALEKQTSYQKALHDALQDELRSCPNEKYCKNKIRPHRYLLSVPKVFTVGVIWNSDVGDAEEVMWILEMIGSPLDMAKVFDTDDVGTAGGGNAPSEGSRASLTGVICYYGKHYAAYIYNMEKQQWVYFDDSNVRDAGTWEDVKEDCRIGRLMPAVLFYEVNGVNTTGADGESEILDFSSVAEAMRQDEQLARSLSPREGNHGDYGDDSVIYRDDVTRGVTGSVVDRRFGDSTAMATRSQAEIRASLNHPGSLTGADGSSDAGYHARDYYSSRRYDPSATTTHAGARSGGSSDTSHVGDPYVTSYHRGTAGLPARSADSASSTSVTTRKPLESYHRPGVNRPYSMATTGAASTGLRSHNDGDYRRDTSTNAAATSSTAASASSSRLRDHSWSDEYRKSTGMISSRVSPTAVPPPRLGHATGGSAAGHTGHRGHSDSPSTTGIASRTYTPTQFTNAYSRPSPSSGSSRLGGTPYRPQSMRTESTTFATSHDRRVTHRGHGGPWADERDRLARPDSLVYSPHTSLNASQRSWDTGR